MVGDRDYVCPPVIGEAFAARLPKAELRIVDGTHQLLFGRWRDILAQRGGLSAANSSVTSSRCEAKRKSAAGRPPVRPGAR